MAVAAFDTLKFANALKAAGVPDKQAEAHAAAFAEAVQVNFKDLVTKDDLAAAVQDLKRDNAAGRAESKHETGEARTEAKHDVSTLRTDVKAEFVLVKWMLGVSFAGILAVITLLARLMFLQSR